MIHSFMFRQKVLYILGLGLRMMIIMIKIDMVVMMRMMKSMMVRGMMNMLRSIAGWGVVPRMAPPPSQGDSTLRGREREKEG